MWIFLNDAFLSIVAHLDRPEHLLVRARVAGDIERVFPDAESWEDPSADYRYRAEIAREAVSEALGTRAAAIDYGNFKGSVPLGDRARRSAYKRVWSEMNAVQRSSG